MEHKVYFQDEKASDILWAWIITWYWEANGMNFTKRLYAYLKYLVEKEDSRKLIELHNKVFWQEETDLKTIQNKVAKIIEDLNKINNKKGLVQIHNIMFSLAWWSKWIDEVKMSDPMFFNLTDFSKKKSIWYNLKLKYPKYSKKELKELVDLIVRLHEKDDDVLGDVSDLWADRLYYNIWTYLSKTTSDAVNNIIKNWEIDDLDAELIVKLLMDSWVSQNYIEKFEDEYWVSQDLKPTVTEQVSEKIEWEKNNELLDIHFIERKNIADFNPFLLGLTFKTWYEALWMERFIEIYEKIFANISYGIIEKTWWIKPSFNKFIKHDSTKLTQEDPSDKEKKFSYQFIIEFDVPKDFDIKKLREIWVLLNEEIGNINLTSLEKDQSFKHPLSTMKWKTTYSWYFSDSWEWFADNSVICQESDEWEKKVRLTLSDFTQDEYIYLIVQIGYFINNEKFINKNQLYFDLYHEYNKTLFSSELFDITILKDKYEKFLRDLIIPLSKEWLELWLKADNLLLAWPYGTSKSQFLMHLLLNKKWEFNNKEFLLNASVIPIWLQEFKALLMEGVGWIKTRIDQIYQRTHAPIILIVEDLDTLVNEKKHDINDEIAQSMTIFFEWLGSLPVTVVTTSNDPTKFSERLIRPNRISKIIIFDRPNVEEKKKMLFDHLKINNIELSSNLLNIIYSSNVFENGTASHMWEIAKELNKYLITEKEIFANDIELDEFNISHIINDITISIDDLNKNEVKIENWYKEISWEIDKKSNIELGIL